MKFSNYYSYCGIVNHPITQIIENLKKKGSKETIVICNTDEIFDEAMTTIMNRFPQAIGLVTTPNPGTLMGKRKTDVIIPVEVLDVVVKVKVMTAAEYEADKSAIDRLALPIVNVTWSGGQK